MPSQSPSRSAASPARAEVSELTISKQPGLLFAPMILMEHHKLVEKHAKDAGVPGLKAGWVTLMSGGANNDALLSGSLHIVTSGVTNMLLLWGKTNGDVKAIIGVSGLPFKLITRNPNIKTIKDYTANDRIAVPTVRQSIQAITLGIALQKVYGDDKANEKLVPNQVQMGHPDALTAHAQPQPRGDEPFRLLAVPGDRAQAARHARGAGIARCAGRRRACEPGLRHHQVLPGEPQDASAPFSPPTRKQSA